MAKIPGPVEIRLVGCLKHPAINLILRNRQRLEGKAPFRPRVCRSQPLDSYPTSISRGFDRILAGGTRKACHPTALTGEGGLPSNTINAPVQKAFLTEKYNHNKSKLFCVFNLKIKNCLSASWLKKTTVFCMVFNNYLFRAKSLISSMYMRWFFSI